MFSNKHTGNKSNENGEVNVKGVLGLVLFFKEDPAQCGAQGRDGTHNHQDLS